MMIIEKEKMFQKLKNARFVSRGLVYTGRYVHGVKTLIFHFK